MFGIKRQPKIQTPAFTLKVTGPVTETDRQMTALLMDAHSAPNTTAGHLNKINALQFFAENTAGCAREYFQNLLTVADREYVGFLVAGVL